MSMTSGPIVPPYTGNSSVLSPPYVSFAVPLASIVPPFAFASIGCFSLSILPGLTITRRLGGSKFFHHGPYFRVARLGSSHHQVEKVIVGHREEPLHRGHF